MLSQARQEYDDFIESGIPAAEAIAEQRDISLDDQTIQNLQKVEDEAADALSEFEEEGKENREGLTETHEYRDAEGNLICTAEVEFESQKIDMALGVINGFEYKINRAAIVKSVLLKGEKDGKPTSVDVVEFAPKGYKVISSPEISDLTPGYSVIDHAQKIVYVPNFEKPESISSLLHEFGHAEQIQDPNFTIPKDNFSQENDEDTSYERVYVSRVVKAIPEAKKILNESAIKELDKLDDDLRTKEMICQEQGQLMIVLMKGDIEAGADLIEQYFPGIDKEKISGDKKFRDSLIRAVAQSLRQDRAEQKILKQTRQNKYTETGLKEVARLPLKIKERDATRRAFQKLNKIKKIQGINIVDQTRDYSVECLGTYGAKHHPLGKNKDKNKR
ncbi:MAG: hypothetical protein ABII02_02845 [Candidatus Magasanikbacteria bacterium]